MPVVACPKCPAQLKTPDGVSGNVKCPKCGSIFPISAPVPTGNHVTGGAPAPQSPSPPVAPAAGYDAFEVVDETPRRSRDWDDADERPRSRKRDRGDDEYEDRRRRKKTGRHDDDDWPRPQRRPAGFGLARTGALMLGTGAWIYMGTFGLLALLALFGWAGGEQPWPLMGLAGLAGCANWVVSLIGLGFCIAGPERARGAAIAATVLSVVHLGLLFVGLALRGGVPDRFGGGDPMWVTMATAIPSLNGVLSLLLYAPQAFGSGVLVAFLAGGCEVARLILIALTLKGLAQAARSRAAAARAGPAVMAVAGVCGGVTAVTLFVTILVAEWGLMRAGLHLAAAVSLLSQLAYALMMMAPALLAKDTASALAARA
ncbi:hypothetical protein R5W24_000867 [Gemmata sp. JC717]|uniref:hypothetical protein n=1 Tax=Gemmata algarum TaxID=2975278 RepID=UPI0021BBA47A|nr:hypothetical protein [Gemmata algarum]MDY3551788.1 hypothetical protein [Gemmata algarum]